MTLENIMKHCADDKTVLGQTLAYAWKKYQTATAPEERGEILEAVALAIEEGTGRKALS